MAGPRATWQGSISLGLINIPIKVYSATESEKKINFNQINSETGNRISQVRVDAQTREQVPYEQIVKGFEINKGEYVIVDTAELDELMPEKTQTIEIEQFIDADEIDPLYFDTPYYTGTETGAKAYTLLRKALEETNKVAIGRIVMRTKEYLVAIQPHESGLAISTLRWHEQLRDIEDVAPDEVVLKDKELQMATQLIESMTEPFDPSQYTDQHTERVMELIHAKAAGKQTVAVTNREMMDADPEDLFAALEQAIVDAKEKKSSKKAM